MHGREAAYAMCAHRLLNLAHRQEGEYLEEFFDFDIGCVSKMLESEQCAFDAQAEIADLVAFVGRGEILVDPESVAETFAQFLAVLVGDQWHGDA
jgi:hypothetical protein